MLYLQCFDNFKKKVIATKTKTTSFNRRFINYLLDRHGVYRHLAMTYKNV